MNAGLRDPAVLVTFVPFCRIVDDIEHGTDVPGWIPVERSGHILLLSAPDFAVIQIDPGGAQPDFPRLRSFFDNGANKL